MEVSLQNKIFTGDDTPSEFFLEQKRHIVIEIPEGFIFPHRKSVVRADLKPGNVLLSKNASIVEICDMGLSKV